MTGGTTANNGASMRGHKKEIGHTDGDHEALLARLMELEAAVAAKDADLAALKAKSAKVQARLHERSIRLWGQVSDYKNYLGQALSRAERAEALAEQAGLL